MIDSLAWMVAGAGYLAKESIKESCRSVDSEQAKARINLVTDRELEARLNKEILNPNNYNAIWDKLEIHKRDGGVNSHLPSWDRIGKSRLAFFNKKGQPTLDYQGNREYALARLMEMHSKIPYTTALFIYNK